MRCVTRVFTSNILISRDTQTVDMRTSTWIWEIKPAIERFQRLGTLSSLIQGSVFFPPQERRWVWHLVQTKFDSSDNQCSNVRFLKQLKFVSSCPGWAMNLLWCLFHGREQKEQHLSRIYHLRAEKEKHSRPLLCLEWLLQGKDTYFPLHFDLTSHHVDRPDVNRVKIIFLHRSNRVGCFWKDGHKPWQYCY